MNIQEIKDKIREKKGFISDIDGVIYHGNKLLPGVVELVDWRKPTPGFTGGARDRLGSKTVKRIPETIKSIKVRILTIIMLFFLLTTSWIGAQVVTETDSWLHDNLEEWVYFLASDEMLGRGNGSPEMKIAAEYIAGIFQAARLHPGFGDRYIREYTFTARNRTIDERNVAAIIPGTDPALKDEYIIITAHFDHVGIGRPVDGDSIYNGADDNAAGTAAIMGVAKMIMEQELKPGRSILFVAFSGEEMGMRGSRNYVSEPSVDLKKAYLNLNIEMPGYNQLIGKQKYYMTGESQTNIDDLIKSFTHPSGWQMDNSYPMAERLFRSSDNVAFTSVEPRGEQSAGVPSTTLCTHTGEEHIHKPWDEPQFIDYENMTGFVTYLTDLVIWLSNSREEIKWTNPSYVRY
ncbi:MAG: M20/M25/M40 family metallo-hydrolase [Bacteroidales bacterium]